MLGTTLAISTVWGKHSTLAGFIQGIQTDLWKREKIS